MKMKTEMKKIKVTFNSFKGDLELLLSTTASPLGIVEPLDIPEWKVKHAYQAYLSGVSYRPGEFEVSPTPQGTVRVSLNIGATQIHCHIYVMDEEANKSIALPVGTPGVRRRSPLLKLNPNKK
jgi:hypothetical protein